MKKRVWAVLTVGNGSLKRKNSRDVWNAVEKSSSSGREKFCVFGAVCKTINSITYFAS